MNISLRKHGGGFSGKAGEVVYEFDTADLLEASRKEVLGLVAAANLSTRPPKAVLTQRQSQASLYSLQCLGAGHDETLEFHLDAVDESMQELVSWIQDEIAPISTFKPK